MESFFPKMHPVLAVAPAFASTISPLCSHALNNIQGDTPTVYATLSVALEALDFGASVWLGQLSRTSQSHGDDRSLRFSAPVCCIFAVVGIISTYSSFISLTPSFPANLEAKNRECRRLKL